VTLTRADIATAAERLLSDGYELWLASNDAVLTELELEPCGSTTC
jgi:hypothetical protein